MKTASTLCSNTSISRILFQCSIKWNSNEFSKLKSEWKKLEEKYFFLIRKMQFDYCQRFVNVRLQVDWWSFSVLFYLYFFAFYSFYLFYIKFIIFISFRHLFSIIKLLASNKDDKRRVEKALDAAGLPSGKGESLAHNKFQFEDFYNLYKNLTQRSEVEKIFEEL